MTEQETQEFATSRTLFEFYRSLISAQSIAIDYVRKGRNLQEKEERASKVKEALIEAVTQFGDSGCPDGQVWDPVLGACVREAN